jgi:hypothetical protein
MRPLIQILRRSLLATLLATVLLTLVAPVARAQSIDVTTEYRIKAAYLYNFTKFIDWPPPAFAGPGAPFIIGVVDPVGTTAAIVEQALQGKHAPGGRAIEVRRLPGLSDAAEQCHQLFITRAAGLEPDAVHAVVGDAPVVVVGETTDFAAQGGVIGFFVSNDGVHCDVNLAGARRAGIKLSGRLASVARLVREGVRR